MKKIRVLLAEDHCIVRKGLRFLLENEVDIEVVGEVEDGREAIAKAEQLHPDVAVMDIAMPGLNGLEATRRLKSRLPETKVVILTMHTNEEYVFQALRAGASAYVVKNSAPAELIMAIRASTRDDFFLSPCISGKVIEEYIRKAEKTTKGEENFEQLTAREREILQLIAEGWRNREIAEVLSISTKTVETHRASLMEKLNLHSAAELTKYAIRKGLTRLEP